MSRRRHSSSPGSRRAVGAKHPAAQRGRFGRHLGLLLLGAVVLVTVAGFFTLREPPQGPPLEPPRLDVSGLDRALVRPYERYLHEVLEQPRSADAWGKLGMFFFAHQFEYETNICLAEAARLDPQEFRWPYLLGLNLSVSDPDAAARHWLRAAELRPSLAVVHLRLGELYLHQQQYARARQSLQLGLQREPREVRGLLAMSRLELEDGRPAEALNWLYRIPDPQAAIRAVFELRSRIHQHLGDGEAALRELAIAEQLPDETPSWRDPVAADVLAMRHEGRASLERAEMLMQQQQVPQAISLLEEALDLDQRDPQIYTALAKAYLRMNQLSRAEAILQNARKLHPHSVEVWFQSGVVSFQAERFTEAAAHFRVALQQKPEYAPAHYNLGHTLLRLGDPPGAVAAFADAVRHRPTYGEAHINLARLYLQQGDRSRAAEHVRMGRQLAPRDPELGRLVRELSGDGTRATTEENSP